LRITLREGEMVIEKFGLKGKSGIVTGGGSGIGKGIARGLVQAGAEIVITGRRKERLEQTAQEIRQFGGPVIPVQADISRMGDIRGLVNRTMKEFGKIDFLFNNAGTIRRNPPENYSEEDWDEVININLKGSFFLAQAVAREMISRKRKGNAASKAGLIQLTKSMANDWAQYNILVNAIGPGWVNTELTEPLRQDEERFAEITSRIPLGRWAEPEDLAGTAVFLASDASDYITGQTIFVDGGWLSM
jgi:2-deoxy-D-gluconate 3-dehydrogenase